MAALIRRRWYQAEWGVPLHAIGLELKRLAFQDGGYDGFVLERTRQNAIGGSYYEQSKRIDTVRDPFGRETVFERIEYRRSDFLISNNRYGLEIVNPGKNVQALISRMIEVSKFRLALLPVNIDPLTWANHFQEIAGLDCFVDAIQITNISMEHEISGTLTIKGSRDVIDVARLAVEAYPHKIEKVHLRLQRRAGTIAFSSNGTVTIKAERASELAEAARQTLLLV